MIILHEYLLLAIDHALYINFNCLLSSSQEERCFMPIYDDIVWIIVFAKIRIVVEMTHRRKSVQQE